MFCATSKGQTAAEERGRILAALDRYFGPSMAAAAGIFRCAVANMAGLSHADFEVRLSELSLKGYIKTVRADAMPGYPKRADWLDPSTIMFAKLLPRGNRLLEGSIPSDPDVTFIREQPEQPEKEAAQRADLAWIRQGFDGDMRELMTAFRDGDSLAGEVIGALTADAFIDEPLTRATGRRMGAAQQRGQVLSVLAAYRDYGAPLACANSVLKRTAAQGDWRGWELLLTDLRDRGYIEVFRAQDMRGYLPFTLSDRPDRVMFLRLTPKGTQLVAGTMPKDPEVRL